MKKSTIFGLRRLIARPEAQVAARLAGAGGRVGEGERRAVADGLHREPGEVERAGELEREEGGGRGDDQRREADGDEHGVDEDAAGRPEERREAGGAALGHGAAEEEGHVRAGGEGDHHHGEREGQEDAGVGQHRSGS